MPRHREKPPGLSFLKPPLRRRRRLVRLLHPAPREGSLGAGRPRRDVRAARGLPPPFDQAEQGSMAEKKRMRGESTVRLFARRGGRGLGYRFQLQVLSVEL